MSKYIRPIVAYRLYQGLKLHFCKIKFNIFDNKFPKISGDVFDRRNDAKSYARITTKYTGDEVFYYFLANVLEGNENCLYNTTGEGEWIYKDYKKKIESVEYRFYDELTTLSYVVDSAEDLYKSVDNEQPLVVQYLIGGLISLETFCLLQLHCYDILNIPYSDYLWDFKKIKIRKYMFFFTQGHIKYSPIVINKHYEGIFK